jgi:hypothetical protein
VPRIRTIKPEFFSHEKLASKSAHARLLAIGLLTLADCEGRLRWVPMQIHAQVFPWEAPGEAFENIDVLLGELIDCDYVVHYELEGKRYVEVCNFKRHQRLSGKEAAYESRLPAPPQKDGKTLGESGEASGKQSCASLGSGGNPLGTGEQGNHRNSGSNDSDKPNPPPTPPKKPRAKPTTDLPPIDGVDPGHWQDWIAARRKKNAGPITASVVTILAREATRAGISVNEAVLRCAGKGWINFDHTYGNPSPGSNPVAPGKQLTPMGYGKRTDMPHGARTDLNGRN